MRIARIIRVVGIVQGVGFRPFVKILADRHGVSGYVRNLGGGEVEIYVEGDVNKVEEFIRDFLYNRPAAILIEELHIEDVKPKGLNEFSILRSSNEAYLESMIPPDFGICDECLREVLDPNSRRSYYPFNSCAFCGPRFAIIDAIPYDRQNTSWASFPLCPECEAEYWNPDLGGLRRFYYQGISCPKCGPRIRLLTAKGEPISCKDPISEAARLIDEGFIIAVKGVGGYHIAALASSDDVVLKLRRRKKRPEKPFAIMALDVETASKLVYIDEEAKRLLQSPMRPIVLLPKREDSPASKYVSPGLDREGVFLPYAALHYLLLYRTRDKFAIMTSGNIHGEPMCTDLQCVIDRLGNIVDYILDHDLPIRHRVDDSVARFTNGRPVLIRRSRGYAPMWIKMPRRLKRPVIAFGADLQNTGGIGINDKAILTQFIGDLDSYNALLDLDKELRWFTRVYRLKDPILICDANPSYKSRWLCERWAEELKAEVHYVYHHHAHALSTAADWGIDGPFVAITIDGVGYGIDGNAWGGEVLVVEGERFERFGCLAYTPMPGGDLASIYPARMALSYLVIARGVERGLEDARELGLIEKLPRGEAEAKAVLRQMTSSPLTSSLGRFLDAVSALLGVCWVRTYEGEPAMKLEAFAKGGSLLKDIEAEIEWSRPIRINVAKFFDELVHAFENKANPRDIAYTAQYLIGKALGLIACKALEEVGGREVYASGGAAVNDYVTRGIEDALREECNASLKLPRKVPPGDGGISLGQVYFATYLLG